MTTGQSITAVRPAAGEAPARDHASGRHRVSIETAAYAVFALLLAALVWHRVQAVDGFYLDEWVYTHGGRYIWDHFPGGLWQTIPQWTRGPQRLYSLVLALPYGLLSASAAYTVGHVLNVVLLVSGVVPLALLARRLIDTPYLRVLAVVLGLGLPWLVLANHLLTENLAFPLFLWASYAFILAAERPTLRTQLGALALVVLLGLCRVNLAALLVALALAVVAAEARRPFDLRATLRRRWPITAALALAIAGALVVLVGDSSALGTYGGLRLSDVGTALFGAQGRLTRAAMLTYTRDIACGVFVLPFVLGLATALAGAAGCLGRRLLVPGVVTVASLVVLIVAVSVATRTGAQEERYVFYPAALLAVLAVAGLERLRLLRPWTAVAALIAMWALVTGQRLDGTLGDNFFARPGAAFWGHVLEARLDLYERKLFGWMLLQPTGWLLVALGLAALVALLGWPLRRRPVWVGGLLTAALALCAVAQLLALNYDAGQELYGTKEHPGGLAMSGRHDVDREAWLSRALPGARTAAVLSAVSTPSRPGGDAERLQFWSANVTGAVAIPWTSAAAPVPPGGSLYPLTVGADGRARPSSSLPRWVVAEPDDPRVQLAVSTVAARSPDGGYSVERVQDRPAVWTTTGVDADGAVRTDRPARLTLDRAVAHGASLRLAAPAVAPKPVDWTLRRGARAIRHGRLAPGATTTVRLTARPCGTGATCPPAHWTLATRGPATPDPLPVYGPPPPPRPVGLFLTSAHLER